MGWASNYMNIPFVPHGRVHKGCDCWGLIRLATLEQQGWVWPDFAIEPCDHGNVEAAIKQESAKSHWLKINLGDVLPFDVVVLNSRILVHGKPVSAPTHVGIISDERKLLHTQEPYGVAHVPLDHISVKSRIVGAYRWQP